MKKLLVKIGFRFGTSRMVFFIGRYAIKVAKINNWKFFLKGILANLDENMWYKNSPLDWQLKMTPALYCIFGGIILISYRANELTDEEFLSIDRKSFEPLPLDFKIQNFGKYNGRIVLIDYADTKYWCYECENLFCQKGGCK